MKTYDIREFGAVADGVTMNTAAIQSAIDAAAQAGGGKVLVNPENHATGIKRTVSETFPEGDFLAVYVIKDGKAEP